MSSQHQSSAQWRSESTSTSGRCCASATNSACTDRSASSLGPSRVDVGAFVEAAQDVEEPVGDALDLGVVTSTPSRRADDLLDPRAHLLDACRRRRCRRPADRLRDRPPRVRLAVRGRTARDSTIARTRRCATAAISLASRLLPTPASPKRSTSCARRRGTRGVEQPAQQRHLGLAPDERRGPAPEPPARRRDCLERDPSLDRVLATLDDERAQGLVAHRAPGGLVGELDRPPPGRVARPPAGGWRCSRRRPSRCSRLRRAARRRAPRPC